MSDLCYCLVLTMETNLISTILRFGSYVPRKFHEWISHSFWSWADGTWMEGTRLWVACFRAFLLPIFELHGVFSYFCDATGGEVVPLSPRPSMFRPPGLITPSPSSSAASALGNGHRHSYLFICILLVQLLPIQLMSPWSTCTSTYTYIHT